jgi:hypothetical protein
MRSAYWKREIVIAAALFGCGFLLLPAAIYWVGKEVVGGYGRDEGMLALADTIWGDFLTLEPAAWILVFSPYLLVQLIRLIRRTWRAPAV